MTDPIRIPIMYPYTGDKPTHIEITPTLARRIVALAQADATPVAGCIHDPGSSLLASRICQRGQKGCVIDHDAQPVAASTREAIERGMADSNAGRVTEMDFSQYADEPCPHCGKPCDTWFDRSLDADGNMATRCRGCGNDVDKPPVADDDAAVDALTEHLFMGTHMARDIVGLIKSGKVPGLYACKSDAEIGRYHVAYCEQMKQERDKALSDLAACRACDDQHVRDLEACYKVHEELRAELAAEKERTEKAETEAAACNDLCSEIDADSPAECIREVRRMRRDLERLEDERDKAERDANHYQTDLHVHVGYLRDAEAQRDRLAKLLRIVAGRHEHGQPIPSREIAAALAELEKTK